MSTPLSKASTAVPPPPLVSVLCRTMGRSSLSHALQSIADQIYPSIEVILVDASGRQLDLQPQLPEELRQKTRILSSPTSLDRPRAANAALDAAAGEYLLFLDEDDWIAADHIQTLVDTVSESEALVAYSCTQKVDENGNPLDIVFSKPFDAVSLKRDNYIPIHSALFARELINRGCRFDESLPIYEDWDFWLQCSVHTSFRFVSNLSAFYRAGGESDTATACEQAKYEEGNKLSRARETVFAKWLPRWSGQDFNAVLGSMEARIQTSDVEFHATRHKLQITEARLSELKLELADREKRIADLDKELGQAKNSIADLENQIGQAKNQIADLENQIGIARNHQEAQARSLALMQDQINAIYASTSWRLTKPLRWLKRSFRSRLQRQSGGV